MSDFANGFAGGLAGATAMRNAKVTRAAEQQKIDQTTIDNTRTNAADDALVAKFGAVAGDPTAWSNSQTAATAGLNDEHAQSLAFTTGLTDGADTIKTADPVEAQTQRAALFDGLVTKFPTLQAHPDQMKALKDAYVKDGAKTQLAAMHSALQNPAFKELQGTPQVVQGPNGEAMLIGTTKGGEPFSHSFDGTKPLGVATAEIKADSSGGAKLKQDEQWVDPADHSKGAMAVPGSTLDLKAQAIKEGADTKQKAQDLLNTALIQNIDTALGQLKANPGVAGVIGSHLAGVPLVGQANTDFAGTLEAIKGGEVFRQFEAMKNAAGSTGLGRLLGAELPLLQNRIAALNQNQSAGQLKANLASVRTFINNLNSMIEKTPTDDFGATVAAPAASSSAAPAAGGLNANAEALKKRLTGQ